MIKLRKVLSGLVATIVLITNTGTIVSVSASAADPCDINRDGVVDNTDLNIINNYLSGKIGKLTKNDIKLLDVNKNLTIDYSDRECIKAKCTGKTQYSNYYSRNDSDISPINYIDCNKYNADDISSESRTYKRYLYGYGQLTDYTLTPTLTDINVLSPNMKRAAIGKDDRELSQDPEDKGIVLLSSGTFKATGFIVGDHQIATAAHCVMKVKDDGSKSWRSSMNIYTYTDDGTLSGKTLNAVEAHVPRKFVDSRDTRKEMHKYDYALITVSDDLSKYVQFDLACSYNINESNYDNIPLYVTGRPAKVFHDTVDNSIDLKLYTAQGKIKEIDTSKGALLNFDVDTSSGQSGSPVYTIIQNRINNKISYNYIALGILSGIGATTGNELCNRGPAITKLLIQFYRNNPTIN